MKVKYTIKFVQYGTMVHSTLKSIYKRLNSNSSNTYKKMFYNKRCYSKISCHSSSNNIVLSLYYASTCTCKYQDLVSFSI